MLRCMAARVFVRRLGGRIGIAGCICDSGGAWEEDVEVCWGLVLYG